MESKRLLQEAKPFIEAKILQLKKKFELIYSTTRDSAKKASIQPTIEQIDKDLKKLRADVFETKDLARYELSLDDLQSYVDSQAQPHAKEYKILRNITIEKLCPQSNNNEVNAIWTYLNYFGKEYMGLLSEQNLRMDYGHSYQRDKFFTLYNQTIRVLEDYGGILQQIQAASDNKNYRDRLLKVQSKEYRDVIIKAGRFLHSIRDFIDDIHASEGSGERVLLEADKKVEIHGVSNLNGLTTRKALEDLFQFISEFIEFLKIPDLKKIEEEDEKNR